MTQMLAAVLVERRKFDVRHVHIPLISRSEVLIRVTRTGICGTDVHIFNGHYASDRLPLIPGHEFCGVVAAVGQDVAHLREGDPCVADINIGCGSCFWCRRNEVLSCPDVTQVGISRDGAFAEYVAIPARLVIPVRAGMPPELQALVEPLACVVRAARKAQVTFGQSAVVLGAGPIGNLHVQMLRLCGVAPIISYDLNADRCHMALEAGADIAVSDAESLRTVVLSQTQGRGADLVIESVGAQKLYELGFELIRKGGRVAFFGITGPQEKVSVDILRTVLQENSLKGSVAGMGEDMHDALTLLANGRFKTDRFTRAAFDLSDIQSAFDSLPERSADLKTQIVIGA